jgi:hypothetical protein
MAGNGNDAIAAAVRTHKNAIVNLQNQVNQMAAAINMLQTKPDTVWDEINKIPGRWIESTLSGEVTFAATDEGKQGTPIIIVVSQDGPFIQTHYPLVLWFPSAPDNATNFGRWRPVSTFPLPTQVVSTDIIDLQYQMFDGGSQRDFQNAPRGPLFSRPDNVVPLPCPVQWAANATLKFTPIYQAITFNGQVAPTQGTLHVDFPGIRIVNL